MGDPAVGEYTSLVTKDEFVSKSEAMSRALNIRIFIRLGMFFGALFAGALLGNHWEKHYHISWAGAAFMLWLLVAGGVFCSSLVRQQKKLCKQFELCCGACGCSVAGKLTLLSGNCPNCGNKILSDVSISNTPAKGAKESRVVFISKFEALTRKETRRQVILLAVSFSAIAGCIPLAKYLDYLVRQGKLDWAATLRMDWVAGAVLGGMLIALVVVAIYSAAGKEKRIGIPCPRCKKPIFGVGARIAIATRACPYCGEAILD